MTSILDYSTTASDNTAVDGINIAEGCDPANINNAIRSVMANEAKWLGAIAGGKVTGGTANAQTLATGFGWAALQPMLLAFKAGVTNTGGTTLNVDGLGAKPVRKANGGALIAGDITAGLIYLAAYEATAEVWILLNVFTIPSGILTTGDIGTLVQGYDADTAKLDVEDQVATGGARITPKDLGTVTTGTVTPDPGDRGLQYYTNGGAHTLAPGSNQGSYIIDVINGSSPGAIGTSGWTNVIGSFNTTPNKRFRCYASIMGGFSELAISPFP